MEAPYFEREGAREGGRHREPSRGGGLGHTTGNRRVGECPSGSGVRPSDRKHSTNVSSRLHGRGSARDLSHKLREQNEYHQLSHVEGNVLASDHESPHSQESQDD